MNVGQRIKARRKELGISAETLAAKLGMSPSTIYRYESGSIEKLDSNKLEPIADALYTSPLELMGLGDKEQYSPEIDTSDWIALAPGFKNIPVEKQQEFKQILSSIWDSMYRTVNGD